MKIGIITLPMKDNYGGILQNYALQCILKESGNQVETIHSYRPMPLWKMSFVYARRAVLKFLFRIDIHIFHEHWAEKNISTFFTHINRFINNHISIKRVEHYSDIKKYDYDAFIVGSDQVWRPVYIGAHLGNAYLSFTNGWKNVKRIAYAVSFGVDHWEYNKLFTWRCCRLAQKFDAISVREISGIQLCEQYLHCKAQHVLDPTMLLTADDYRKLINEENNIPCPGKIFSYILDSSSEMQNIVLQIEKEFRYKSFHSGSYFNHQGQSEYIKPPVEHWLKGFDDAKFVITDSFHATVFSILFGKPFIVVSNPNRGLSRINTLLSMFGLQHHLLIKGKPINLSQDYTLDMEKINATLDLKRKESTNFLKMHLK